MIEPDSIKEHLPSGENASPFFNDHVSRELGLSTREHQLAKRFQLFRRLPESARNILITRRRDQSGEEVLLSPWVELLSAFHRLAWGEPPDVVALRQIIDAPASEVAQRNAPLPALEGRPAAILPAVRIPRTLSASGCQQLIDCPYLFFAAQGLRLAPPDTIREALEKAISHFKGAPLKTTEGQVICECFGVTYIEIERAIRENNLATVEDVTNYTKAGGG